MACDGCTGRLETAVLGLEPAQVPTPAPTAQQQQARAIVDAAFRPPEDWP